MLKRFILVMGCAGILSLAASAYCLEPSGCVTCHTDEDMLEENLSKVKSAASAMQSGAG